MSQRSTQKPCTNTISLLFSSPALSAVKLERKWSDWINYIRATTQESRIVCNSTVVDTTQECVQTEFKYFPTFLTGLHPNPCNFQHRAWLNHYVVYSSLRLLVWSFERRNREPEDSRIDADKQSRSGTVWIATFLLFSNMPTRSIITITWPSFVFNSASERISSHFGRSCIHQYTK